MIQLPEYVTPIIESMPYKLGAQAYSLEGRRLASMANRARRCDRVLVTATWRDVAGPNIATKSPAYPTTPVADCITRIRVDIPQDLTEQTIRIRGLIYAPDGNAGTLEDFTAILNASASPTYSWTIGPITLAWSDVGAAQWVQFEIVGSVDPRRRLDAAIGTEEETWLNFYGTWTADGGSTGTATLAHLTVIASGRGQLEPDLTAPQDVAASYPLPGDGIDWEWYNNLVQAQDLLYEYDSARILCSQVFDTDYAGYGVALTAATYTNALGDNAFWWIPVLGRKYDEEQISLLVSFYSSGASIDAKIQWAAEDDLATWTDAGADFTPADPGWNREERQIDVGSAAQGIAIRLMAKGSTTLTTSAFGVRYYHHSIMADII